MRQEFVEAVLWVGADPAEHVGEVGERIDPIGVTGGRQ
jgi:hypothetical protein